MNRPFTIRDSRYRVSAVSSSTRSRTLSDGIACVDDPRRESTAGIARRRPAHRRTLLRASSSTLKARRDEWTIPLRDRTAAAGRGRTARAATGARTARRCAASWYLAEHSSSAIRRVDASLQGTTIPVGRYAEDRQRHFRRRAARLHAPRCCESPRRALRAPIRSAGSAERALRGRAARAPVRCAAPANTIGVPARIWRSRVSCATPLRPATRDPRQAIGDDDRRHSR